MYETTQFDVPTGRDVCDVVVGFDFGTSCSKVILRTPFHNGGRAFAVPFGEAGHDSCRYLLPSVLWVGPNGRISLTRIDGGRLLRDVKFHLMHGTQVPA